MVETTGLQDFARLLGDRGPFGLLAVKVKAGAVAAALADTFSVHEIVEDAAVAADDLSADSRIAALGRWSSIVQLRDDPWSHVVWRLGPQTLESQGALAYSAQDLTATFDTEAVAVVHDAPVLWDCELESESQRLCCVRLYRAGELVEELVAGSSGRVLSFESEDGAPPAAGQNGLDLIDHWLIAHGISVPGCLPEAADTDARLRVDTVDPERMERCILLMANLNLPLEEETLDMLIDQRPTRHVRVRSEADDESEQDPVEAESEPGALGRLGRLGRWMGHVLGR